VKVEWLIAAVFLASGASLLVYILAGLSLGWTLLALALAGVLVLLAIVPRLAPPRRRRVLRRLLIGAVAGLVATVAYDAVRLGLVQVGGLRLNPVEAWRLFGVALAGPEQSHTVHMVTGTAFHVTNGIAFGTAYTVALGQRGPWAGLAWAFVLEAFMVSVYPGWLNMKALDEFLSVSITGHVAYGLVLGWLARSLLRSSRWGEDDRDPATDTVARVGPDR
jgi:hypothetical protein